MRRLPLFSVLAMVLFGVACAGPETTRENTPQEKINQGITPAKNPTPSTPDATKPPRKSFTTEVLNDLLVAEFARQRNRLPLAASRYLDAAIASRDAGVAEEATRAALLAKDQKQALRATRLWMEIDPRAVEAKQIRAALLIDAGRIEETVPILDALLSNPDIPSERRFTLVGELVARAKDKKAASAIMERIIAEYGDNPHALFAFGRFLVEIEEKKRAVSVLERVIAMDEKNALAWLYYAQFLQSQGKTAQAIDTLSRALARGARDKSVRIGLARLLISENRYQEAWEQLEQRIAAHPEEADVRYLLALFLMQIDETEEARKHLLSLVEQGKFMHAAYFNLGQIAESQEDLPSAMDLYRKVEDGQHYLDAQARIADLLARQGEIQAAREHLHGISPQSVEESILLYRTEGAILTDASNFQEAMSVYDAALGEHPENTELLYERAMLAARMDLLPILEQDLQRVLSREPDHADALNALGYTLADQTERHQEAFVLIQRALALSPDSYHILDSMGWVLYRLGRHQKALHYLQRALALRQDAEIAAHLGEVLWVTGNQDAARDVFRKALEKAPDDKLLLKVIERFGLSKDE
uniref:Tetratricopeptide repeat-containing protein n=1 Tax=Candidatus Kentrum sp. LPFa TaxID=2126335 RepID=A0A450WNI0_9GAMM|nr:MAG: Tetratricopeptide repeat-containing protein [Candidatus Kentron sp. LPFa]